MELAEFYQFFYALAVSGLQTSARQAQSYEFVRVGANCEPDRFIDFFCKATANRGMEIISKILIICHWFIALIYLHRLHVQSVCQWKKLIRESRSVHAIALSPAGRTA